MPKLNTKTVTLTGTEINVKLIGNNCDIRNDGTDTIYVSGEPNITVGADGVMSIPAGQAAKLLGCKGTLYLIGTGNVQLCGNDHSEQVFKCAPAGGGSGTVDQPARDTINIHMNNMDIHLSTENVAELISNQNLLINSDFKNVINQRGQTEYNIVDDNENSYSIDCWRSSIGFRITVNDGLAIEPVTACAINTYGAAQVMNAAPFIGKTLTFSADINTTNDYAFMIMYATSGNGTVVRSSEKLLLEQGINHVTISNIPDTAKKLWVQFTINSGANVGDVLKLNWAKLENGSMATPFTPVDSATELVKCQRFYQIRTTGDVDAVDLRPAMGTITDIRQREDGYYEYIAEL